MGADISTLPLPLHLTFPRREMELAITLPNEGGLGWVLMDK